MGRFILLSEDAYVNTVYLSELGICPSNVLFTVDTFCALMTEAEEDDIVMVIIKGLTDFTFSDTTILMKKLAIINTKVKALFVFSDVDLLKSKMPYYLYNGDLYFSDYTLVENGKKNNLIELYTKTKLNKLADSAKEKVGALIKKDLFGVFKLYRSAVEPIFHNSEIEDFSRRFASQDISRIVTLDVFKGKTLKL